MDMQIMSELLEAVKERMGTGYTVELGEALKNNDTKHICFMICKNGDMTFAQVCVDGYLEAVEHGKKSVQDAAEEIVQVWHVAKGSAYAESINNMEKKDILQNVIHCVVNAADNESYLADKVFRRFLDLAVIYRFIVEETEEGISSVVLTKSICEHHDVSMEELEEAAVENAQKRGFCARPLNWVLASLSGLPRVKEKISDTLIWVCTNSRGLEGAAFILYGDCLAELANKVGADLYILPSSIHEVLAIPVRLYSGEVQPEKLCNLVSEINDTQVPEDEVLSNNAYYYSRQSGKVTIIQ